VTENNALLVRRILRSHPRLVQNPDHSLQGNAASSLHLAASLGHTETCRVLLEHGHELPTPALNAENQTALMVAAAAGHTDVVHILADADPTCILRTDVRGRDAIMEACRGGHDTCLQILLTMSPDGATAAVARADIDGNTALHFACAFGHQPLLRTLLAAKADPLVENAWHWAPGAYSATVQGEVYLKNHVADMIAAAQAGGGGTAAGSGASKLKGARVVAATRSGVTAGGGVPAPSSAHTIRQVDDET
jgi:ankyrin repeat protein